MNNSKLIVMLSTFKAAEWRKFGDFLASPFFNKRADLLIFYNYLKSITPNFTQENLKEALVFKKVYPNKPFNNRDLVYLNNYMLKKAERFLAELQLEKKEYSLNSYILEELLERKLEKQYRRFLQRNKKLLQMEENNGNDFYLHQYQISDLAKRHFIRQGERKPTTFFQESWDDLDKFYFFNKLKAACEIQEYKNIIAIDYEMPFVTEVVGYLKKNERKLNSNILIYLSAYTLLIEEPSEINFVNFRNLIKEHFKIISTPEKQYLYMLAINYCGQQIKTRNNPYYYVEQCLELYMEGIQLEFLLVNGLLSRWTFKNVVKLGFNLKNFNWTEQFIQTYYSWLEEEFQEDALHFNLADLNYRKKAYKEAQHHLLQVKYSDIFYNLGAKAMLIKIYYETNEEEALLSNLASFTIFLKRNKKITSDVREIYLNFTNLLNRLLRSKREKIEAVLLEIKQKDLLTNRSWLIEIGNLLKIKK